MILLVQEVLHIKSRQTEVCVMTLELHLKYQKQKNDNKTAKVADEKKKSS